MSKTGLCGFIRLLTGIVVHTISTIMLCCLIAASVWADTQQISGWVEDVYVYPQKFLLRAKIDTGAKHSSLNAAGMTITGTTDKQVKFDLTNRKGQTLTIEKPVHRTAVIRRHEGKSQERPVIMLELCLGGVKKLIEVNLIDREGFDYQLLVGRSFLNDDFLVDPGRMDLIKNGCTD